ncbi:MAG: hypothetical protein K9H16_03785 [Bacteroidales bacterium]|nr:hypothetical protein [Bacteroidales bacterium]
MKVRTVYFLIILFFLSQLPFLTADPDTLVDLHTMGAWTDEGLYASQARNFIHYGDFGINDNTTFVRGPIQVLLQVPVFYCFGTSLVAARMLSLVWVCIMLLLLGSYKPWRIFMVFLLVFAFTHFRVFNFSHYAMAEMMAVSALLAGFMFLSKFKESNNLKYLFLSTFMVFISWGLKIQYIYFIALPPAIIFLFDMQKKINREISFRKCFVDLAWVTSFSTLFVIAYLLFWYLPNKDFYDMIMFEQTEQRYDVWTRIHLTMDFNIHYFILNPENYPLIFATILALLIWAGSWSFSHIKIKNQLIVIIGFIWLISEFHKLGMTYLPQRYLLGLYVAAGFFASAVLFQFFYLNKYLKTILIVFLLGTALFNGYFNFETYQHRTYELKAANEYLKKFDWEGKTIAGVWAPSITWQTKARVIPVWSDYADPETFFENYTPSLIVAEANEGSSGEFYRRNGFNLAEMSDSVRFFNFWRYDLNIYWLKNHGVSGLKP